MGAGGTPPNHEVALHTPKGRVPPSTGGLFNGCCGDDALLFLLPLNSALLLLGLTLQALDLSQAGHSVDVKTGTLIDCWAT